MLLSQCSTILKKKQNNNPKKVYAIDTGLVEINTPSFTKDMGHKLENLVFLALRQRSKEIYYYSGVGECDFLIMAKGVISRAVQVCLELNNDNLQSEISGLYEAMEKFKLADGTIVTLSQNDSFDRNGMTIKVVPFHEFVEIT